METTSNQKRAYKADMVGSGNFQWQDRGRRQIAKSKEGKYDEEIEGLSIDHLFSLVSVTR